jgi:F0F1-type ATP synthase membrane subunit b/b'
MKLSTFLQLFLLFDVFLMGVLAATAVKHAYAHFRPPPQPEKPHSPAQGAHLPAATREQLLQTAQTNFQKVLDHSAAQLEEDLETTAARLNKTLEQLGGVVIGNELERYRKELIQLRKQAETDMGGIRTEMEKHQAELKDKLAKEVAAEKQILLRQIDTKLADAVGSFLVETLQHNVDLGAQSSYLTALLEEHKDDFTKEVADEAPAAR